MAFSFSIVQCLLSKSHFLSNCESLLLGCWKLSDLLTLFIREQNSLGANVWKFVPHLDAVKMTEHFEMLPAPWQLSQAMLLMLSQRCCLLCGRSSWCCGEWTHLHGKRRLKNLLEEFRANTVGPGTLRMSAVELGGFSREVSSNSCQAPRDSRSQASRPLSPRHHSKPEKWMLLAARMLLTWAGLGTFFSENLKLYNQGICIFRATGTSYLVCALSLFSGKGMQTLLTDGVIWMEITFVPM